MSRRILLAQAREHSHEIYDPATYNNGNPVLIPPSPWKPPKPPVLPAHPVTRG